MQHTGRRLARPFVRGYRVALLHARRSLQLVEEDLCLEREEVEALRAEMAELRALAGLRDPALPLN